LEDKSLNPSNTGPDLRIIYRSKLEKEALYSRLHAEGALKEKKKQLNEEFK